MIINNLSYTYPGKVTPVLKEISFTINEGAITGLFGPNGSGKTTLLKCISGFYKTNENCILFGDGTDIYKLQIADKSKYISYVPQELQLEMPFTVYDIVMMGLDSYNKSLYRTDEDYQKTDEIIRYFGLESLSQEYCTELSGGQKQLVSVARAVNQRAKYLLLDEPVSNLDYSNAHMIWNKLVDLNKSGKTIVVSSHEPNHILKYCDDVVLINHGMLDGIGKPKNVLTPDSIKKMFNMSVRCETIDGTEIIIPR